MPGILSRLLDTPPRAVLRAIGRRFGGPVQTNVARLGVRGFTLDVDASQVRRTPETDFIRDDGTRLPVFPDYRYAVKSAWRNIPDLNALAELARAGALDEAGQALIARARGSRTLAMPLDELAAAARPFLSAHRHMFIVQTMASGAYPTLRTRPMQAQSAVRSEASFYSERLRALANVGYRQTGVPPRALEIGAGQGTTIAALAALGFEATAIDNDYEGTMDSGSAVAQATAEAAGVAVRFERADATKHTPFDDGTFDLIVSNSVLEHIQNLPALLEENARLLSSDGVLLHRYHPFFGPSGGHAYGTLDAPWGHVRISAVEMKRYIDTLRAYEAPLAKPWLQQALTRDWPLARVQSALAAADLDILWWIETPAASRLMHGFDAAVVADALARNPGISLADLTTDTVEFACRRRRK